MGFGVFPCSSVFKFRLLGKLLGRNPLFHDPFVADVFVTRARTIAGEFNSARIRVRKFTAYQSAHGRRKDDSEKRLILPGIFPYCPIDIVG
jgi:hypothetical protein